MLAAGVLAALVVTFIFWALLQSLDMQCTVMTGRHSTGCPGQSCFCTDCDPCNLHLADRNLWQWEDFECRLFGLLPMNRCILALGLNLCWLGVTLRLSWQLLQALRRERHQASASRRTLWLVFVSCCLSATNAMSLPWSCLSSSVKLLARSFVYNIINTCLLASAMSVFFQLLASQPLQGTLQREWDCFGRAFNLLAWYFLRSFLPTAFLGELFVMVFARSTESTEEFVEQENKFYLVFLILGVLLAWLGLKVSATSRVRDGSREHTKLRRIVFQLFIVKLVWFLCRGSHWALMCSQLRLLASKYNFFMVVMERLCALQTMLLLKEFSLRPLHGMVASPSRH